MKSTFVIKHPLACGVILDDLFTLTFIIFNICFLVEVPESVFLQLKNQEKKRKENMPGNYPQVKSAGLVYN